MITILETINFISIQLQYDISLTFILAAISQFVRVTTISVIITALGTLVIGAFLASFITYRVMKRRALTQQWQQQLPGNYDDVVPNLGVVNRSFEMEGNIAYGPIRKYSMEENAAYVSTRST